MIKKEVVPEMQQRRVCIVAIHFSAEGEREIENRFQFLLC